MNKIYIYNGDFVSLLSLIHYLISNNIRPYNIQNNEYFPNLLEEIILVNLDNNEEVIKKIISIIGREIFKTLYYVFLSADEKKWF